MVRTGAKSLAVAGVLITAAGFGWQSTMGVDGSYLTAICLPGVLMMAGAGLASTPARHPRHLRGGAEGDAGLVSGLVSTSRTMGGALGLAVLSTVAAARTAGSGDTAEITAGYALAFRTASGVLLAGVIVMLLWLPNHRGPRRRPVDH